MTTTQIAYWTLQEEKRKNLAQEKELNRSNLAREAENYRSNYARESENTRSNVAKERENERSNRAREAENARSNIAREDISRGELMETSRANREREAISAKEARDKYQNYLWQTIDRQGQLTETRRSNRANEGQREIDSNRSYDLGIRSTDTAEKTGKSQRFANYTKGAGEIWKTVKDAVKTVWDLGKAQDTKLLN